MTFLSPSSRNRLVITAVLALSLALALGDHGGLLAQEEEATSDSFEKQSGALRTALHYDPSLGQPLRTLVQLYEKADRTEELLGLYRAHLTEYPDDSGARVVLIRLLKAHNRAEAGEMIQSGVRLHADEPMLHYLLYETYRKSDDPRALATLSTAIELQSRADRRDIWLDELLELSRDGDDTSLAEKHLVALRDAAGNNAGELIAVAQRMHRYGLHAAAMDTLKLAQSAQPDPESGVEIEVLLAKTEAALGDREAAGARVQTVLKRLAADHWRRRELMNLRLQLVGSESEREALLEGARMRFEEAPDAAREAAALDYAGLLSVAGRRREAAELLVKTSTELPASERLEKAALEMLERIADEDRLRGYLEQRVALQPERADLLYRLTKSHYLAGNEAEAETSLEAVLETLDADEGLERLLDLARYLRKMSLAKPSAELLRRVVAAWPQRLDVRRELAEALLGLGERPKAAELLRASDVEGAEIENLLDLVQFMLASKFHVEARDALQRRLAIEPGQFELSLLMVEVLGRTSERQAGERLLAEARELADTPARYRRWLGAGFAFHEIFDSIDGFFDREQFSFAETDGDWDVERVDRFLALIEAGAEGKLGARVTQALRNQLAQPELPVELAVRLRLLLVKALESSPEHAVEVEQHLRELAEVDAARASEYALRRALLYHAAQRPDLAQELIADLDLSAIDDKAVLRAAYVMFLDYAAIDAAVACVERLAEVDATDLVNFQRQLSLYAALGEEDALRRSLRRLLAGLDKIEFDGDTLAALRGHLLDSYWRSISARINDTRVESRVEMTDLLDAVERESLSGADRLWVLWTRAFLLNQSGQEEGRDEALAELEKAVVAARTRAGDETLDADIVFPDGLGTSLAAARVMLSEPAGTEPVADRAADRDGPLQALHLAWAFECDGDAQVIQIEPVAAAKAVLALDDNGVVYCIDAATGKLRWRERFTVSTDSSTSTVQSPMALAGQLNAGRASGAVTLHSVGVDAVAASEIRVAASLLSDGGGRFYLPIEDGIRCHAVDDGRLLWETDLALGLGTPPWAATHDLRLARPNLELSRQGERLLAYAPAIGVAAALDADSGKLVWLRTLSSQRSSANAAVDGPVFSLNSGAAFGDGKMLVFGAQAEILDAASGETLWSLGLDVPRRFPLRLQASSADDAESKGADPDSATSDDEGSQAQALSGAVSAGLRSAAIDHRADRRARFAAAADFVQFSGTLLAPAAHWAQGRPGSGVPHDAHIVANDLLLLGQGMYRISLSLPIGASQIQTQRFGEWIGLEGSSGWMLHDKELRRIDMNDGREEVVSLDAVAGEFGIGSAILHGGRIYAAGENGILVINAFSGGSIATLNWPDALTEYQAHLGGDWGEQVPARRVWQGGVYAWPGRPVTCIDDRMKLRIGAQGLYLPITGGSFVALVEAGDEANPGEADGGPADPKISN